ncbi:MAG: NAD-dependent epimerase/dehydratase family protein [Xanthomonadales bacterium]|nr:NAD-dependent epimerase/dehydratase family protein [Xanthomonadales bacterium]
MQTILGANGQIAIELARELRRHHTREITLVSRHPRALDAADRVVAADLLDARQTADAVRGSRIVYFTAGLPPDARLWEAQFPTMLANALAACRAAGAAFAYFDNTYMYPQDGRRLDEGTAFAPNGPKGRVRARMAEAVLAEMARGDIPVLIARAPEFHGPGRTQSFTNALVIDRIRAGRKARVPLRDDTRRTLIWTPDASRALAVLGNTPDAYGQTWHLPCCDDRPTYAHYVTIACDVFGRAPAWTVLRHWQLVAAGLFSKPAREIRELLPRYAHDNLFDSTKFKRRFPDFAVTSYRAGLEYVRDESVRASV